MKGHAQNPVLDSSSASEGENNYQDANDVPIMFDGEDLVDSSSSRQRFRLARDRGSRTKSIENGLATPRWKFLLQILALARRHWKLLDTAFMPALVIGMLSILPLVRKGKGLRRLAWKLAKKRKEYICPNPR